MCLRVAPVVGLSLALAATLRAQPEERSSREPIDLPGGSRVEFSSMKSDAIHGDEPFSIFLPPSYRKGDRRYPVVYFLHGMFNDDTSWTVDNHGDIPAEIDGLMSRGELPEMVLVHPDGGRSFYTDSHDGTMLYEKLVVDELPRYVEATYRVEPGASHRAIAGTSMGGYGALKIAMKHPHDFAAVAAHSPIVFPANNPMDVPESSRSSRQYQYLSGVFAAVYGDPFDQAYFDANNPLKLAASADIAKLPLYFDYGTADRYEPLIGLGRGMQKLDEILRSRGIPHEYHSYEGEPHGWALVYTHIGQSLRFVADHLKDSSRGS
jgi:putative tributyrin esterase